jgi:prepilin-type N-terminal cleavage/methylation domain-containing protein
MNKNARNRKGFTLIELIAVIVVLAILGGVALPKYFDYAANAKEAACKGTLGAVRAAIANFYANAAINGSAGYPTLAELEDYTNMDVMQEPIPANPYNEDDDVAAAVYDPADPPVSGTNGWNYTAANGKFWANSDNVGENEF